MVNWTYRDNEITEVEQIGSPFGFVYRITNLTTGMIYVGSKQVVSVRKKKFGKRKIASMGDRRKSKYDIIVQEMKGWKSYTGSSKLLNEHIARGDKYIKEIVELCSSKTELKYKEVCMIICEDTLVDERYYNANVSIKQVGKLNFNK